MTKGRMARILALALTVGLAASAPAFAQVAGPGAGSGGGGMGGGQGGGMGGGGRHGGGKSQGPSSDSAPPAKRTSDITADKPASRIEIVGVIREIDRASGRITIAYEPVDELNWPRGTMPFPVSEESVFTGATVGEKVRFKVDSHEIYELRPY